MGDAENCQQVFLFLYLFIKLSSFLQTMTGVTSREELIEAAANLYFYYGVVQSVNKTGKDPKLFLPCLPSICVALEAGIEKTIKGLAEAFPVDRQWVSISCFHKHLENVLKLDGCEGICSLSDEVACRLRDDKEIAERNPSLFEQYLSSKPRSKLTGLLWRDDVSKKFMRAVSTGRSPCVNPCFSFFNVSFYDDHNSCPSAINWPSSSYPQCSCSCSCTSAPPRAPLCKFTSHKEAPQDQLPQQQMPQPQGVPHIQ